MFKLKQSRGLTIVSLLGGGSVLAILSVFLIPRYFHYRMESAMGVELQRIEMAIRVGTPLFKVCIGTAYLMNGEAFRCLRNNDDTGFLLEYHGSRFTRLTETAVILQGDAIGKIEEASDTEIGALSF